MTLIQKLKKLRHISPHEAQVRLRDLMRIRAERKMWAKGTGAARVSSAGDEADAGEWVRRACQLIPGTGSGQIETLQDQFADVYRQLKQTAESNCAALLNGQWTMLGHCYDVREIADWQADPRTDFRWEEKFYADLPLYQLPKGVDFKYVWELGRHQFVVELARGWLLNQNEEAARLAQKIILDWISRNPIYGGIHWTSALEVAMRAMSWIWTLATLSPWSGWHEEDLQTIRASLIDHGEYLAHHFSYYSSPYNHLIGEASGLYWVGYVLGDTTVGQRWMELGAKTLNEHGPRQFHDDGFTVEQATGYHFYTLGFLLSAISAGPLADQDQGPLRHAIRSAYQAAIPFRQPDGCWPAIGDVDSARSIPVHPDNFWRFDSICSLCTVMLGEATRPQQLEGPGAELFWLTGVDGVRQWMNLPTSQLPAHHELRDSGYAIGQCGQQWALLDAGPIAAGLFPDGTPSTAHGHLDTLQVLSANSQGARLYDPGMPFYGGPSDWVDHFRSDGSHNTLEIEDAPPAKKAGRLAWAYVMPRPALHSAEAEGGWMATGHAAWGKGVEVQRHVLLTADRGLWIADWIDTDRPRRVKWYWHVNAAEPVQANSQDSDSIRWQVAEEWIDIWSDGLELATSHQVAQPESPVAWRAPEYGLRTAGVRITVEATLEGPALIVTRLADSPCPALVKLHGRELSCERADEGAGGELSQTYGLQGITWCLPSRSAVDNTSTESTHRDALSI